MGFEPTESPITAWVYGVCCKDYAFGPDSLDQSAILTRCEQHQKMTLMLRSDFNCFIEYNVATCQNSFTYRNKFKVL